MGHEADDQLFFCLIFNPRHNAALRTLTLHSVLHILGKQVPHHLSADFTHVELLGKS